ncbi:MAG: recombinase family protein [Candidatus Limnocylindria bacterium]
MGITRTQHEAGGHNGRDPYGYRTARDDEGRVAQPHRLEPVEDEAAVIREAFDAYGLGRLSSHAAVAADRNRRGIARRGKPWSKQSVRDIFRRAPFYAGQAVYRRGKDERPGLHEPIITALTPRSASCYRRPPLMLLAFDRAAARILPLGASLRDMPPANQRDIIRHIVERVEMHVRDVGRIVVRAEAAPFSSPTS